MLLKPIPADELAGFQHKVFAAEALKGQRSEWGFKNRWDGDYLSKVFIYFFHCADTVYKYMYSFTNMYNVVVNLYTVMCTCSLRVLGIIK